MQFCELNKSVKSWEILPAVGLCVRIDAEIISAGDFVFCELWSLKFFRTWRRKVFAASTSKEYQKRRERKVWKKSSFEATLWGTWWQVQVLVKQRCEDVLIPITNNDGDCELNAKLCENQSYRPRRDTRPRRSTERIFSLLIHKKQAKFRCEGGEAKKREGK